MALRRSLSTFIQSSLRTTLCNSRIVNKNFNGGFPNTNFSSEFPPPPSPSLEIPKTATSPFPTKRSLCDVSWEKSNTDLLPPPTPRPISREEVEAVLKLLNDVSSVLNDFLGIKGTHVLPVNSSGGSLDEEGLRNILVDIARRNRKTIGEIVELADNTFKRSKFEMDRMNGLIDEVCPYGFGWMCTLFGWKFSWELRGGRSRVTDRRWETLENPLKGYGLPQLNVLDEDFDYLENIKCVEDGVRYCLHSSHTWPEYLKSLEGFKVNLKEMVAALEGLDRANKLEQ